MLSVYYENWKWRRITPYKKCNTFNHTFLSSHLLNTEHLNMKQFLLCTLAIIWFCAFSAHGQIGLPKGKDILKGSKVSKVVKNNSDGAANLVKRKLLDTRKDYDPSNFNYAISFTDNSGLFETKEKYQNHKALLKDGIRNSGNSLEENANSKTHKEKGNQANALGEILYASNKYKSAEASFLKATAHYELGNHASSTDNALTLSNLGLLYQTRGRYTRAETYTVKALQLRERMSRNTAAHAASINNLAVLRKEQGQYNEAEKLIEEAIKMNADIEGKESISYAISVNNKAMLYQAMGRYDEAEKLMQEAIKIAEDQLKEKSANRVRFNVNLALLYQETGKYEQSEEIYLKCITIKEKKLGKHHPDYAHLKRGLASLYLLMGKEDDVPVLLEEAAKIYKNKFGAKHPSYATTIDELGNFYRSKNMNAEADELLTKAVEIRKEILGEEHPDYITSLEHLALLEWQFGSKDDADLHYNKVMTTTLTYIEKYFAPMSESEKAKFWHKLQPRLQRYNSFLCDVAEVNSELKRNMFNYQLRTKALLLNSTNKVKQAIMASGNQALIDKYLEWLDKKEDLARLYTLSKSELAEEEVDLAAMEAEANQLEKELSAESNVFSDEYAASTAYTFKRVKGKLEANEAVVEIIRIQDFHITFTGEVTYAALVFNKDSEAPELVKLKDGKTLEGSAINNFRDNIYDLKTDADAYNLFWKPVDAKLGGMSKVYVSLDGVYNMLSLNAVKEPQGKFLIDKYTLVVVTNSKDIISLKSAKTSTGAQTADLFGYPNYGDMAKLSDLPGTKLEVENIDGILKKNGYTTNVYMTDAATEEQVKKSEANVLHIATHGFFLPDVSRFKRDKILGIETSQAQQNPLHRSGLILAGAEETMYGSGSGDHSSSNNGILTAYETMNMSLDNTELVVLSACETGLGDVQAGEGVYGLQRAFQVAGAKNIIMSLWQVSDEATMMLMTEFYKNLAAGGSKQEAFLKAQKAVKAKFPEPFYWGAFIIVGH